MLLTRTAEYALRLMALLAHAHNDRRLLRSQELAADAGVPNAYVSKILRKLVLHGLLRAEKGHGGGFSLAKSPSKIKFEDIFDAIGEGIHNSECVFGWGACSSKHPCLLHESWSELKGTIESWAASSTLDRFLPSGHFPKQRGRVRRI